MTKSSESLPQTTFAIVAASLVLISVGLLSIAVSDTHYAEGHDGLRNAFRQSVFVLAGVAASAFIVWWGHQRLVRASTGILIGALILLIPLAVARTSGFTFGGLAAPRNGAYRWIHLPGFQLQPSELVKIAAVLALARYLRIRQASRTLGGVMLPLMASLVPLGLILIQPDLGTALLIVPVLLVMLLAAGAPLRYLVSILGAGVLAMPLAWSVIHPYQRLRVSAILMQSDALRQAVIDQHESWNWLASKRQAVEWPAGSGYQLIHSKNAVGSGGGTGYGWGAGPYTERNLLPDRHNDFVFAVVAHQWGFAGCALVIACLATVVMMGLRIASATRDPTGQLVAVGVTALFGFQSTINVAMTIGLMPVTGMTLPFVSYGGSSMLTSFVALGLLVSVARHRPYLLTVRPQAAGRQQTEQVVGTTPQEPNAAPPRRRPAPRPVGTPLRK